MNFQDSIKTGLSKYADFTGRASRSECWWFVLFAFLVQIGLGMINHNLAGLAALALLLPYIAVFVRRLHDTDRTGWWMLLAFIPVIGVIVLIVFGVLEGTKESNRFGLPVTA
jgi:Predicted membrane protein